MQKRTVLQIWTSFHSKKKRASAGLISFSVKCLLPSIKLHKQDRGVARDARRTSVTSGYLAAIKGADSTGAGRRHRSFLCIRRRDTVHEHSAPRVDAFIPVFETAIVFNDLITACLLFAQFFIMRWRALLVLANGFLFTGLIIIPHALTFPGAFAATGLLLVDADLWSHKITVSTELRNPLPQLLADRVQLQQVFLNLFMNAIEAMRPVTDRVRQLRIRSDFIQDRSGVLVTIADSGTGIDSTNKDRIFEPFFSTKSTGTGIGLAICKSIVEAHGGHLRASANQPHGTIFHVALLEGE
jgi:hypothetical protein